MRVELLLELSGLSRQEIIVIKACAPDAKSFESVAATLVEQYSGVHLRQGTMRTQKATEKTMRSPQKLDMLYSYIWQHMQPLVKQKAKVKARPRKVRAKVRARLCVAT